MFENKSFFDDVSSYQLSLTLTGSRHSIAVHPTGFPLTIRRRTGCDVRNLRLVSTVAPARRHFRGSVFDLLYDRFVQLFIDWSLPLVFFETGKNALYGPLTVGNGRLSRGEHLIRRDFASGKGSQLFEKLRHL